MLTLERIATAGGALPALVKVGLVFLFLSGFADLISHVDAGFAIEPIGQGHGASPAEATSHLAIFVSMVLIFVGVLVDGVRRSRVRRPSALPDQKGVA
jgi:hypothetical protein